MIKKTLLFSLLVLCLSVKTNAENKFHINQFGVKVKAPSENDWKLKKINDKKFATDVSIFSFSYINFNNCLWDSYISKEE